MSETFLGNPVSGWLTAAAIFLAVLAVLWLARHLVGRYLEKMAKATTTAVDDVLVVVIASTRPVFLLAISLWTGSKVLEVGARAEVVLGRIALGVVLLQIGVWATTFCAEGLEQFRRERADQGDIITWVAPLAWVGKAIIWSIILLIGLEKLGADITSLVTGLGIGGIAVALAVQSVLGDLFSAFSIFIDKPFVIGDYLVVDNLNGTVEHVGFKTTRLRSLNGEQLVFSNSDLVASRIQNFGSLVERRAKFTVGVTYDTPPETLESIPGMIREIIESHDRTRFERSHFKEFGDSALVVETVYQVLEPAFQAYMEIQEAVNLELMQRFAAQGIEFAYPTQTILLSESRATDRRS